MTATQAIQSFRVAEVLHDERGFNAENTILQMADDGFEHYNTAAVYYVEHGIGKITLILFFRSPLSQ